MVSVPPVAGGAVAAGPLAWAGAVLAAEPEPAAEGTAELADAAVEALDVVAEGFDELHAARLTATTALVRARPLRPSRVPEELTRTP